MSRIATRNPIVRSLALVAAGSLSVLSLSSSASEQARRAPDVELAPNGRAAAPVTPGQPVQPGQPAPSNESTREVRRRGHQWLVAHQKKDGGWGAGSWGSDDPNAPSDVATTSLVVLSFLRSGEPERYTAAIEQGVRFVARVVDESPGDRPELNTPLQTQPQYKLGRLVDTHMASLMLGEVVGTLPSEADTVARRALGKVVQKVQLAQKSDGSFDDAGWAPVLSSSMAASSLLRAQELGEKVDAVVLKKSADYQAAQVNTASGGFATDAAAGVELYSVATALKGNNENKRQRELKPEERVRAEEAEKAAVARVAADADGRLVSGFGSMGGEEMLSYTMISDSLAEAGGSGWKDWEKKIGSHLTAIQNADGSWSGSHCITSTTFVTAAALMTLGSGDAQQVKLARVTK